jgi:arylsulfatase A-like enzyme
MNVVMVVIDTLRRDHLGAYGTEEASRQLASPVLTPAFDALAARSTSFNHAYLGSFPCLPARRDLWTGRFEFPWRSWGPLEDDDLDLFNLLRSHGRITALVSDHYHLLERDAGNYHFGFDGWEMIRGQETDPLATHRDPTLPKADHLTSGVWPHHVRNLYGAQRTEEELYAPRVFRQASAWLERNASPRARFKRPFCLLVECFDPHEPWDPPLFDVERFDPGFEGKRPHSPVYGPASRFTEAELRQMRALYAAELTLVDRWFGRFLDTFDRLGLGEDTLLVVSTDHGFFLGEHGLVGKPELVPLYAEMSHIPLFVHHPDGTPGARVQALVQWVDLVPTVLNALELPLPEPDPAAWTVGTLQKKAWEGLGEHAVRLHGKSLLPLIRGEAQRIREVAVSGKFGDTLRVTDGRWSLYLPPRADAPLTWYGRRAPGRTFVGRRGPYDPIRGGYPMTYPTPPYGLELYDLTADPKEERNVHDQHAGEAAQLKRAFRGWLEEIGAPPEVGVRYGVAA